PGGPLTTTNSSRDSSMSVSPARTVVRRRSATSPATSPDLPKRRCSRATDCHPSHPSSPEEPAEERVADADPLQLYEYGRPRRSLPHGHVWTLNQPVRTS